MAPGAVLVCMPAARVPGDRPEDFVALARRLRGDARFAFVVRRCGSWQPAGDQDGRLVVVGEELPVEELIAAADIVCLLAEHDRTALAEIALALGVAVLATRLAAGERAATVRVVERAGDVAELARAATELAEPAARRRLVEASREVPANTARAAPERVATALGID